MTVTENKYITINYTFKTPEGTLLGTSDRSGPLTFRFGSGDVISGLEKGLEGLAIGDSKSFTVSPDQAYGLRDEEFMAKITRSDLPEGLEPRLGTRISWPFQGQTKVFMISDISGDEITLDGNHPLAGIDLEFDVTVLEVGDSDPFHQHGGCGCGTSDSGCGCGSGESAEACDTKDSESCGSGGCGCH